MDGSSECGGSVLFKTLLGDLDDAFLRTDDAVRGMKFESAVRVANNQLTRKQKEGVVYFDSADRTVFPYAFEQVAEAMPKVMVANPATDFETIEAQDEKDTITVKYLVKYQLTPGESGSFRIYAAAKKFRENDRLVLLWRSFTEGLGRFEGWQSDDTTWMVVRPSSVKFDRSYTVLESYTRLVPIELGNTSGCDNINSFVNIIAKSGEEEFKQMMHTMEKMVINATVTASSQVRGNRS
ncbi:hypothetical protein GN244_ATG07118 [Phytophthora infestans]|uniref:M96 mating-specific protein family n=1 Tax=Phytophthora infestans TaxID=4787 RepID=A0A833W369_PHYIN|nr:hypothetical protein GN244_ATG07118 [Phytophthora infestans]KAF4132187.1 hypothetical protein GN958_ATG18625 [Phytophthora infestans]